MTTKLIWLSFADGNKPKGSQFLGVCIVEVTDAGSSGETFMRAVSKARILDINPGGEVKGFELGKRPHESWLDRLLTKEMIEKVDNKDPKLAHWHRPFSEVIENGNG